MEHQSKTMRFTTHPMLLIAAIAVVLFCGVGIAAVMGWLPHSGATMGPPVAEAPVPVGTQDVGPPPPPAAYAADRITPQRAPDSSGYSGGGSYGAGADHAPPAPAAAMPVAAAAERAPRPAAVCSSCGVVESVRQVTQRAEGSGLGAAGGAIVGGLLGNQIGSGSGRKLATVAGAVGGAVVGNQVEGNMKASTHYVVRVRMDNGKIRTVNSGSSNWQAGDHVKIVKGRLQRR
ncbi:glycine zipper 2TM domain-containing protein [Pseudoduganella sp. OTU4001]|uniref:glycine zipper 2TM domain-containing protein n=1 Tax=Pseudoduganella sp. OTU4001 TaxID=3043854 RepID=UPI00313DE8A9